MHANRIVLLFFVFCVFAVVFIAGLTFWRARSAEKRVGTVSHANRQRIVQLALTRTRQSGGVMISRIQDATTIDGFPCSAGWVHFYESGKLRAFSLDEPAQIQGNQIPKGTWIRLNPDSSLAWCSFPADAEIQGHVCKGGAGGAEGVATAFYPDGRLSAFFLRDDTMIDGISCKASAFSAVHLHENGVLKQCVVARDSLLAGRALSEGQTVLLDAEGRIQSVSDPPWYARIRIWAKKLL